MRSLVLPWERGLTGLVLGPPGTRLPSVPLGLPARLGPPPWLGPPYTSEYNPSKEKSDLKVAEPVPVIFAPSLLVFGEPSSFEKWRGRSLEIASVVHAEPRFNRACLSVSPAHARARETAIDV